MSEHPRRTNWGPASGATGFFSIVSRLVAGNADARRRRVRRARRRLRLESLEERTVYSAGGLDSSSIAPMWFADVSGGASAHAGRPGLQASDVSTDPLVSISSGNTYDWIVRYNASAVASMQSLAQTTTLLAGSGIEFETLRGLGLVGQVLVRSSGASQEAARSYLAANANVAQFELDVRQDLQQVANDPRFGSLWGMENTGQTGGTPDADIDVQTAWNLTTGSRGVVVAIVDTGVDYQHPDLAGNIWTNPGEIAGNGIDDDHNGFVDDVHGYDFANNDGDPVDDNGHGTHVAGTIGAVGNNSVGVAGVNWNVSIMALKFLDATGSGYTSDAVRAINYATMMRTRGEANVRVTSNSWGGSGYSAQLQTAIQAGGDAGILCVAAAGNAGQNNDVAANYPSNYNVDSLIAVAATDASDNLATFSNYGATSVDLAAPGVGIVSTYLNNGYATLSGTSMATPHVSGVAALAWALAPNATVAEVRAALLAGVDPIAGLHGKVASGGRLNAANTLALLASPGPRAPSIASLAASPDALAAGVSLTLTARGVFDADGTVARVDFYEDTNGDGQIGAGDRLLGSDATIVGGEASIGVGTAGWSLGRHVVLAVAVDNQSLASNTATASLEIVLPDDHGDTAAAATRIAVGSTTPGVIGRGGDVDYFAFDAVGGRQYDIHTTLGTLSDSTLSLYDRNGSTQLRFDDDSGVGYASQITWTAPVTGTYYVAVSAYNTAQTGSYTLTARAVGNSAPTLAPIADQTLSHRQSRTLTLSANDADGDAIGYSAAVVAIDPVEQAAYDANRQLGLSTNGVYYANRRGANEKWIVGTGGASYYILPNGELHRWTGALASSPLVAQLNATYWQNPRRLTEAAAPVPGLTTGLGLRLDGNSLTLEPTVGVLGTYHVVVSASDGNAMATRFFHVAVTNTAPTLAVPSNQTMAGTPVSQTMPLAGFDADGDPLSYSAVAVTDQLGQAAYSLDQRLGLRFTGSYNQNWAHAGERWMTGNSNVRYYLLPNGELHRWGGSLAASPLVARFSAQFYAQPELLWNAVPAMATGNVQLAYSGGVLTIETTEGVQGTFLVRAAVSDSLASASQTFRVCVRTDLGGGAANALATADAASSDVMEGTLSAAIDALAADSATPTRLASPVRDAHAMSPVVEAARSYAAPAGAMNGRATQSTGAAASSVPVRRTTESRPSRWNGRLRALDAFQQRILDEFHTLRASADSTW